MKSQDTESIITPNLIDQAGYTADEPDLDPEQERALNLMENSTCNIFITGKAGTGKSYLIRKFEQMTRKRILKIAPTGRSAMHIGGATMHSTFGFHYLEYLSLDSELTYCGLRFLKPEKKVVLQQADVIIIDEISMVRPDQLDRIDKVLRALTGSMRPYGGKQIIIVGDPLQLPPVVIGDLKKYLWDRYGGLFFYYSDSYQIGEFQYVELTQNHRQQDSSAYYELLNRIREGRATEADILTLNARYVGDDYPLHNVMTLFPTKAAAEALNAQMLLSLEGPQRTYDARVVFNITGDQQPNLENNFQISEQLTLKPGALVMMVANDCCKRWVNGTIGFVKELYDDHISVSIEGRDYDVLKAEFCLQEAIYDMPARKIRYRDTLVVEQFPMILCYGMTIHKSQGMTCSEIACDISQCCQPGQAYVALSRCTSLDGLHLLTKVPPGVLDLVNFDALAFLEYSRNHSSS